MAKRERGKTGTEKERGAKRKGRKRRQLKKERLQQLGQGKCLCKPKSSLSKTTAYRFSQTAVFWFHFPVPIWQFDAVSQCQMSTLHDLIQPFSLTPPLPSSSQPSKPAYLGERREGEKEWWCVEGGGERRERRVWLKKRRRNGGLRGGTRRDPHTSCHAERTPTRHPPPATWPATPQDQLSSAHAPPPARPRPSARASNLTWHVAPPTTRKSSDGIAKELTAREFPARLKERRSLERDRNPRKNPRKNEVKSPTNRPRNLAQHSLPSNRTLPPPPSPSLLLHKLTTRCRPPRRTSTRSST